MGSEMHAVVLDGIGDSSKLRTRRLPIPEPPRGWVRLRLHAAGVNRSDLHLRLGYVEGVRFPIVPGIEGVGVIDATTTSRFDVGQRAAAVLGGMGRSFDGGYAEYVVVPEAAVIPLRSDLPWSVLGAVPETLQTAYGSLTVGLDLSAGQTLLIRGGTSALGYAVAALAKDIGARVVATTRQRSRLADLARNGVDVPLLDDGHIAEQVHTTMPDGVDAALELVGTNTLRDTLAAARTHGTVCFTGMLSNQWTIENFYPIDYIPRGVRLTAYQGGAQDLPPAVLATYLDRIAAGDISLGPVTTYPLARAAQAHDDIENGRVAGKVVLLMDQDQEHTGAERRR